MRVLFMGTPEFAKVCLERLTKEEDLCISVVTTPDKPQGRHMIPTPSSVKSCALSHGLPLYQPETLKNGAFEEELRHIDPEIVLVVAYGKILPEYILGYPRCGCINLHGSLLPKYRGAAPMQRTIMDGEKQYGVTTMYMEKGLDTGDMLEKRAFVLNDDDDLGVVHDVLAAEGAELLLHTLRLAQKGELHPEKQDEREASYAAKIAKDDCLLDFSKSAREVHNQIRALFPAPLSFTFLRGRTLKILQSRILSEEEIKGAPGTVLSIGDDGAAIACGRGTLLLASLRPEGKGSMSVSDFAKGRGISCGDVLGR